jgi:hypothetical protein
MMDDDDEDPAEFCCCCCCCMACMEPIESPRSLLMISKLCGAKQALGKFLMKFTRDF